MRADSKVGPFVLWVDGGDDGVLLSMNHNSDNRWFL